MTDEELAEEIAERITKHSDDFDKWHNKHYPAVCSCGKKIEEHKTFLNGIAVCEDCFHEATKHIVFD